MRSIATDRMQSAFMLTRQKRRSRRTLYAFRVVMALFGVYFIYHAFHGNHGLLAYAQVQVRVETLSIEKNELEARRAALAARVNALRYGGLDGDLLDEEARNALAVIGHNERLIID